MLKTILIILAIIAVWLAMFFYFRERCDPARHDSLIYSNINLYKVYCGNGLDFGRP